MDKSNTHDGLRSCGPGCRHVDIDDGGAVHTLAAVIPNVSVCIPLEIWFPGVVIPAMHRLFSVHGMRPQYYF